jgi:hypothetical protein
MEPACPQAGEIRRRCTTTARGRAVSKGSLHLRLVVATLPQRREAACFSEKYFDGVVGLSGGFRFQQQKDIIL